VKLLALDVYGVAIDVRGDPDALEALTAHFVHYVANAAGRAAAFTVELLREAPRLDVPGRLAADQVVDRGIVYNQGEVTWVDHHGYATSRYDFAAERGTIRAPRVDDLVELGYLMVHSRLGVHLEKRGLFRLHCLGIALGDRAALVLTPSGGGKSRLALAALTHSQASLLGDDVVLVDEDGKVRGFHSPLGVSSSEQGQSLGTVRSFHRRLHPPKWIVELDRLGPRLTDGPLAVRLIAIARRVSEGPSALVSASRSTLAQALGRDLVVGLGIPQVIELVARRGARDLLRMTPTLLRRARAATALGRGARAATLEVESPETAIAALVAELERA
jgi:hypothetical protein